MYFRQVVEEWCLRGLRSYLPSNEFANVGVDAGCIEDGGDLIVDRF